MNDLCSDLINSANGGANLGYEIKPDCTTEKSLLRFCEHILGVSRTSVNNAVLSELGAFPLSVESNTAIIHTFYP